MKRQKEIYKGKNTHNTLYTKTLCKDKSIIHGYKKSVYKDRYTINFRQKQALYRDKWIIHGCRKGKHYWHWNNGAWKRTYYPTHGDKGV